MRIADHGGVYRPEPEPPPPPPPPPPRPAPPAPEDGVDPVAAHSPAFDPPAPPAPQYTQQQADKDAKTLYDATDGGLTGWGTDEDAIWRTLDGKSAADIDKIRQSYRDHYGKDLDAVLRKETGGKDREHVDALLKGKENRGETDAVKIQAELEGAFGDREEVLKILEKASPEERRAIAEAYARKYGGPVGQDAQKYLLSKIAENPSFGAEERERAGNLLGAASARTPEEARRMEGEAAAGRIKVAMDGWGTDEGTLRDMLTGKSKQQIDDMARAYQEKYGHSLRDRLADETSGAEKQEILSLFDAGKEGASDPRVRAEQDAAKVKQAVDGMGTNEDALRGILGGKSKAEIDGIAAAYQEKYGHSLRDRIADETSGAEKQEILSLFDAGKDGGRDPRVVAERDAARIKQAVDGMGTDEGAIRTILSGKTKAEIDELSRVYQEKYGHDLRGRLDDELGGREQVELLDQAFDRGKIDEKDPGANAERLRRLREQQDVEQGFGLSLTSTIQGAVKGESDEERLDRNVARAEQAAAGGDQARAGQLLGYAEGDLDSMVTAKNEAAEWAATGAAVVASTAVVVGTAGLAAPAVIAAGAAVAGGVAGGGAYWGVQGAAADPADVARQAAIGAATGGTAVVGVGATAAGRTALAAGARVGGTTLREAAVEGAIAGARGGAAGGAADGAVRTATESETWDDGLARGAWRVAGGAATGAATGAVLGAPAGAGGAAARHIFSRGGSPPPGAVDGNAATPAAPAAAAADEAPAAGAPAASRAADGPGNVEAPAMTPAQREAHFRDLGTDPATGNRFRANEADTAARLEQSRGIHLERYQPAPGQKGDRHDIASNEVYDGCSPPPTAFFDRQMAAGGPYERSLRQHLGHPTVDRVVVDVSGLDLTPAQMQALDNLLDRVAGPNNPKIVRLP